MAREPIADHAGDAKRRLPGYLDSAENFRLLMDIIGGRAQLLETDNTDLFEKRGLSGAEGQQLDNLGDILGEERNGRDDFSYRSALSVRILINTSFGTIGRIQEIALSFGDAETVRVHEVPPANLEVIIEGGEFDDAELLIALDASRPLGVRLIAIDQVAPVIPPDTDLDVPADYADHVDNVLRADADHPGEKPAGEDSYPDGDQSWFRCGFCHGYYAGAGACVVSYGGRCQVAGASSGWGQRY